MPQSVPVPSLPSAVVVLAFLGTGFVVAVALAGAIVSLVLGKRRLFRWLAIGGVAAGAAYLAVLLAFSLASRDRTLRVGDLKYFCEIDCHLAYSLENVARVRTGGRASTVATIRTWFDEKTIASWRGYAPISPNPRMVFVLDEAGRRYEPSSGDPRELARKLRPGESHTTAFAFDLPEGVRAARLFLGDPLGVELFLIGHESSLFHRKIYFAL